MEKRTIPPLEPVTLAYIAGLVDGEGTITIQKLGRKGTEEYSVQVSVAQKDRAILDWLKATFACGHIAVQKRSGGLLAGRPMLTGFMHQWMATASLGTQIIRAIQPYLRIKHRHAEIVLEYADLKADWQLRKRVVGERGTRPTPPELMDRYRELRREVRALNRRNGTPNDLQPPATPRAVRGHDLVCGACGQAFISPNHFSPRQIAEDAHYCSTCRSNGTAARAASRAYNTRRKAQKQE